MTGFETLTPAGAAIVSAIAADPSGTLLISDFDGTLSPIVDDPTQAVVLPAARDAFGRVGQLVGQVALVTGRDVRTVRRLGGFDEAPGFEGLLAFGQYGAERWDAARGKLDLPPEPVEVREFLAELPAVLDELDVSVDIEDKGRAVGVHTRRSPDPAGVHAALAQPLAELAARHGLVVEAGRNVWEAKQGGIDKGQALPELVDRTGAGIVVMCGDDLGDMPAFEAVHGLRRRGIAGVNVVAASAEQPAVLAMADVRCDGPDGIAAWLNALADRLMGG